MTIRDIVRQRRIKEVLHFTTHLGLAGTLDLGALKARAHLHKEQSLVHILELNRSFVQDPEWAGHISLSITQINEVFFRIASEKWHRNSSRRWVVLSFHPEILEHPGVHFSTTNNIYSMTQRATGPAGLTALFAPSIDTLVYKKAYRLQRSECRIDALPTCPQAEVLYPDQITVDHLQRVYVRDPEHAHDVRALFQVQGHRQLEVTCAPLAFQAS